MSTPDTQRNVTNPPEAETIRRPDPTQPYVAMSNRKRWGNCALSAVLPQVRTPSGPAAEEGTEAHKAAEWALDVQFGSCAADPPQLTPPPGLEDFDYTPGGVETWRQLTVDCAETYATKAGELFADQSSPTSCLVEHKIENVVIHGVRVTTVADVILWNSAARRLVVGDYKFGRSPVGVGTEDEPNEQCTGAAVLRARERVAMGAQGPLQIGLFVYQPRTRYGEPWQVLAPMDAAWLERQGEKLDAELAAVARAASELAAGRIVAPTPGDHCTYCPSARWCPAAASYGETAIQVEAGTVRIADMTPEEVMAAWASRPAFEEFTKDLRERVHMLHEQRHPAVTLQRRKGNRIWASDPAAVEAIMLADRWDLLRPPGLEKAAAALSASDIEVLTTRAPDVLIYKATAGAQPLLASEGFAKYLPKKGDT